MKVLTHCFIDSRLRGNDGLVVLYCLTLAFDSSPIKGEGILSVVLYCWHPQVPTLLDSRLRGNDGLRLFCLVVSPATSPLWGSSPQ